MAIHVAAPPGAGSCGPLDAASEALLPGHAEQCVAGAGAGGDTIAREQLDRVLTVDGQCEGRTDAPVALQLALTKTKDPKKIQAMFYEY